MKRFVIKLIDLYRDVTKNRQPTCRFTPTCSSYAKEAFETRNFFYAGFLTFFRIIRCNPFSKGGYDPVPKKRGSAEEMNYLDIPLQGSDEKTHMLRNFLPTRIVLYFYPRDNTPGCTSEAKEFTALKEEFASLGYKIVGVSLDSVESHKSFKERHGLDILLLSDTDGDLCEAFDVLKEKKMFGKTHLGVERSTFVLDESGDIVISRRKVQSSGHAEDVLCSLPEYKAKEE